jgi:glycine oxidase
MPAQGWWPEGPPAERRIVAEIERSADGEGDADVVRLRPRPGSAALDAIVVGGGVIGLACAWRAARAGARVRVIERDRPGCGASGVAAGMLAPVGEATWGEEELLRLALAAAEGWPAFAAELAAEADAEVSYRRCGALHVALDRDEAEALERRFELMRSLGLEAERLRPRAAREIEPGLAPACAGAVAAPGEAAVDPRQLVAALVAATEACGVELATELEVVEPILDGDRLVGVRTDDGADHHAAHVVLAAGCWSGALGWLRGVARPPVRPVKGQVLTLGGSAAEPVCSRMVATERVYLVPRDDGRLIVGATVEEQGFDVRVTAGGVHELLREAYRALPDVAELEFVEVLAGMRPGTPDNRPLIGAGALDGLIVATGHYRNGVLLAPVTADAIAALLAGEPPALDLAAFDPARFAAVGAAR